MANKRLSYDALRLAYDSRPEEEKKSSFFFEIVRLCKLAPEWWSALRLWWSRMDEECRRSFTRFLVENEEYKFAFEIISKYKF